MIISEWVVIGWFVANVADIQLNVGAYQNCVANVLLQNVTLEFCFKTFSNEAAYFDFFFFLISHLKFRYRTIN